MNFLSVIKNIAPLIEGTFGTPIMGLAVNALCSVLPSDQAKSVQDAHTADPQNGALNKLGDLVQQGLISTDQIAKAEQFHTETLLSLGYKNQADLAKISEANTASARSMETSTKSSMPAVLAGLAVVTMVALVGFVATGGTVSVTLHDTFMILVGAIIATYKDVYNYYFGSTSSSKTKDDTISNLSSGT